MLDLMLSDRMTVNLLVAFAGGFISFFAPCVTVLVPAFMSHLAGVSLTNPEELRTKRWHIFYNTVFFVIGFTVVFIALGAALGAFTTALREFQVWIQRVGGILIIYLGLATIKLVPNPFTGGSLRASSGSSLKFVSSFVVGSTFAISWSSCVGPILAGIFILAGTEASITTGVILLLAYSIGLMIPFLLVGLFTARSAVMLSKHGTLIENVNKVGGVILILLGILVFTDRFTVLVVYLYGLSPFQI